MAYVYKVRGQLVELKVDPNFIAVRFVGDPLHSLRMRAASVVSDNAFAARFEVAGEEITIVPVSNLGLNMNDARASQDAALARLDAEPLVAHARPVFHIAESKAVAPDRVIIGFDDLSKRDAVLAKYGMTLRRQRDDKVIAVTPERSDVFDLVAKIDEEEGVRFAEPDLVVIGRNSGRRRTGGSGLASSAKPPKHYALHLTKALEAQALQSGSAAITVAILDDGVDVRHPDLKGAFKRGYDAADADDFQEPKPWDSHGTACAGLAIGQGQSEEGARGVAAGCSLFAVRIAYSESVNDDWQMSLERAAAGISWSWKSGADVLSLSWHCPPSNDIMEELDQAMNTGRKNKGCIVVAAAGNHGGPVNFPAAYPGVLCVSASNQYDQIKTKSSADGESSWGSCVGREVAVAAPGVANWTSDNVGPDGYVAGDYDPGFSGTSASTPLVAGACALVLSAKPALRGVDVIKAITENADKVGDGTYTAGRNNEFGFGRLNVFNAVRSVKPARRTS